MNSNDKLDILLKEYDTLRSKILVRINLSFAFLGLIGAVIFYMFIGNEKNIAANIWVHIAVLFFPFCTWFYIGFLIGTLSEKISAIEQKVNLLAGEERLSWERKSRYRKLLKGFLK